MDHPAYLEAVGDDEPLERTATELILDLENEPVSFERFVEDNYARLYGALCLVTGERFEAEDIAQEALVRVLERWDRVGSMEDPQGYLFRTAMNVFRNRLRRAKVALLKAVTSRPSADPFQLIEDHDVVLQGLRRVPADQRAALVATSLLGYSSEDAGRILGTSASNVRARATRARAALRNAIGDER